MLVTIVQCTLCIRTTFAFELVLISFFFVSCLPSNSLCLRKAFAFAFEETLLCLRRAFAFPIEGVLPFKDHCQCLRRAISFAFEGPLPLNGLPFAFEWPLPQRAFPFAIERPFCLRRAFSFKAMLHIYSLFSQSHKSGLGRDEGKMANFSLSLIL